MTERKDAALDQRYGPKESFSGPRECAWESCAIVFDPKGRGSHFKKFCDEHSIPSGATRRKDGTAPNMKKDARWCQLDGCKRQIPPERHGSAKYCTDAHTTRAGQLRLAAKKQLASKANNLFKNPEMETRIKQERQGDIINRIMTELRENAKIVDNRHKFY